MNVLGIDIGGTKIFVGRYSPTLELEAETTIPTLADQPKEETLENLLDAINQVRDDETKSLGIAWAGFVDSKNGRVIKAPNVPGLSNFALCDYITQHTGLPAILENDARAFAYGAWASSTPQAKMCLGLIIGTGVGSGIVHHGEIIRGAHNFAGEVGHMSLQGQEVESWLAGPGLKELLNLSDDAQFSDILPSQKADLEPQIAQPLNVFGQWLGALTLAFDPDHIIIGGGAGIHFWQHFEAEILASTQAALEGYPCQFKLSFYDQNNAGALGAAQLALNIKTND